MIIGLSGGKRVGKDSAADVLCKEYNFDRIAFADPLREICSKVFEIPISTFLNDELKEKLFDEQIVFSKHFAIKLINTLEDDWKIKITNDINIKIIDQTFDNLIMLHPRQILQTIGSDILRKSVDNDIFLKLMDRKISRFDGNIVVTDCRLKNEREFLKKKGAVLCLVKRPSLKLPTDSHSSENDLGNDEDYDVIMNNDGSLSRFQIDIINWARVRLNRRSF